MRQPLTASPSAALSGGIRVPGDKSISHRALILGALATGITRISGLLEAEDAVATAKAMAALGAEVERSNGAVAVKGQGVGGLRAPSAPLDFGNSGTGSRLCSASSPVTTCKSNSPAMHLYAGVPWAVSRRSPPWDYRPTRMRIMRRCRSWCAARMISCPSSTTCRCHRRQ